MPVPTKLAAAFSLCVALYPQSGHAQTISGLVTNESTGAPVFGAMVTLLTADNQRSASATSDHDGAWTLEAPAIGVHYRVRIERIGYARVESSPFLASA